MVNLWEMTGRQETHLSRQERLPLMLEPHGSASAAPAAPFVVSFPLLQYTKQRCQQLPRGMNLVARASVTTCRPAASDPLPWTLTSRNLVKAFVWSRHDTLENPPHLEQWQERRECEQHKQLLGGPRNKPRSSRSRCLALRKSIPMRSDEGLRSQYLCLQIPVQ